MVGLTSLTKMALLSLMSAWSPTLPTNFAVVLALRLPPSVTLDDQADRLPDSKPFAKIGSGTAVFVAVCVREGVAVTVLVGV